MDERTIIVKDSYSNPGPLGLLAFGMTTVLLNLANAGFFEMNLMIMSMGIFYGGIAQVIAGTMEFKKKNTFGTVAFTSYGFFWLSLVGLIAMQSFGIGLAPDKNAMAAFLSIWGIFTLLMFFGTLKMNIATMFIFGSLVILFFLLAIGDATENIIIKRIAGFEGIICGASAIYTGIAHIMNEIYGRELIPIFSVKKVS